METKEIMRALCTATGVAGAERGAAAAALQYLEPLGPCEISPVGSLICRVRSAREGAAHILLDAHLDEIGLVVTNILDDGFLKVAACGGVDRRLLAASRVIIHAKTPVTGVVCSVPPHLKDGDTKKAGKIDTFTIDVGMTSEAAREVIFPGDRVTADTPFYEMMGDRVSCKSLDNRAGCAAVIRAAQLLHEEGPDCGLSVALSSMEEVGGQGAVTAAYALEPTHAIVVDVSFARCDGGPKNVTAELGSGALVGIAPVLSREMSDALLAAARKHAIPFEPEVMGGRTGTNADGIAVSRRGVRTGLLSIPQRNMHTPAEICSAGDVEHVAQLIAAYVRDNF